MDDDDDSTPREVGPKAGLGPTAQDLTGDVAWLWTHCRAIGMTRKSDSRRMRDDVALFTIDQRAEIDRLKDAVRSARADEAHCWARRVETLTAKVQATDERCTQLLQSMAGARAMQPAPALTVAVDALPGMSPMNRTIAYCAADTLRRLGYAWNGEAWVAQS